MYKLTVYENYDERQPKVFRALGEQKVIEKLRTWLVKDQPDVCLSIQAGEPYTTLSFCESEKDWEFCLGLETEPETGPIEEMAELFISQALLNVMSE